jgi:hypothetical protein
LPQCVGAFHSLAIEKRFALSNQGERQMRERREITARADGTLFWNNRMHAAIQHLAEHFDDLQSNTTEAKCEDVCAQ